MFLYLKGAVCVLTKAPRGTKDILPAEVPQWRFFEEKAREACRLFGYSEIRIPMFEHTELFLRGVGEVTDIVAKEMYTFTDKGGRSLTLRPEGTASVARAYLEHKMQGEAQPVKVFYTGPMFRYDRPQAGRYRQFHQFGVEAFGSQEPALDAEVVMLALFFLQSLGLDKLTLHLNSVGCPECRSRYRESLRAALRGKVKELCPDCGERYEKNPLRILDCKNERCQAVTKEAPLLADELCNGCREHFAAVRAALDALGVAYLLNPRLVRGLDYYTKTAFEIMAPGLGAQSSICGGGRYDHLVATIGGPDIPGIGFAIGIERVLLALAAAGSGGAEAAAPDVFVATAGVTPAEALPYVMELRKAGLAAEMDFLNRSLKAQLKLADKKGIRYVVLLGEAELQAGQATVKDMQSGMQEAVSLGGLCAYLAERLKEEN